ncbi:hypothetical protein PRUPE_3G011500 [Prunus persica]|uniref:Uncharacterized protein n=2 Tax=Prunus TaxID=3754 RepID=M5XB77_PRUPE|nr:uncharacterized protein LOC18788032 [Prunus persica]XP_008227869.1 PREDICTED: uncharacterized protein LOC103327338 [Prunus mume]ONI14836.1 hypothetical protein PRUPE_3G011500 [Prunus persica]
MPSSSCRTRTPLLPTTKVNEGRRDRGGAREMGKRVGSRNSNESALTRWVQSVFGFVKFAEFEILFVLFFVIAFLVFKDLTSRPEYSQILVKKPGGGGFWPY